MYIKKFRNFNRIYHLLIPTVDPLSNLSSWGQPWAQPQTMKSHTPRNSTTTTCDIGELLINPMAVLRQQVNPMIIYSEARLVGDSINGELIDYCMEQCGNSRERGRDGLWYLAKPGYRHRSEINRAQLKHYFDHSRELKISIGPRDTVDFKYLKFYKPGAMLFILNLKLPSM